MDKKYTLTDDTVVVNGKILYRIKALRSFSDVDRGDLGGYIESESNLSHNGKCWLFDNAWVYGNAVVTGNDRVSGYAEVSEYAEGFE